MPTSDDRLSPRTTQLLEEIVAGLLAWAADPAVSAHLGPGVRSCRVCGCTDDDCAHCVDILGEPCSWVDVDLCSRCGCPGCGDPDCTCDADDDPVACDDPSCDCIDVEPAPRPVTTPPCGRRVPVTSALSPSDQRLVDAVIAASGGAEWHAGPTDAALTARIVVNALRACLDARQHGILAVDVEAGIAATRPPEVRQATFEHRYLVDEAGDGTRTR